MVIFDFNSYAVSLEVHKWPSVKNFIRILWGMPTTTSEASRCQARNNRKIPTSFTWRNRKLWRQNCYFGRDNEKLKTTSQKENLKLNSVFWIKETCQMEAEIHFWLQYSNSAWHTDQKHAWRAGQVSVFSISPFISLKFTRIVTIRSLVAPRARVWTPKFEVCCCVLFSSGNLAMCSGEISVLAFGFRNA